MPQTIDIYSDVICPWCYLGKKRFESALAQWGKAESVEIRYRPYELNPDTPEEGIDHHLYLTSKMGGEQALEAAHRRLAALGREVGIDYKFELIDKIPNTFLAHRVLWLADQEGVGKEAQDLFFDGYFTGGKDLTQKDTLIELAVSAGMDRNKVDGLLSSAEGAMEVRNAEEKAYDLGITGVPFFVFNNQFAVSGAQTTETFLQALNRMAQAQPL